MTEQLATMSRYDAYKDSGIEWLGDIPQSWRTKRLKYLGYMYAGLAGKKGDDFSKEPKSNFSRFIPFTSISTTAEVKQVYQYVLVKQHEEQNNVLFNDILFLMSSETLDDIGKCSIYMGNEKNLYLNSFCKSFRTTSKFALPIYINYLLQSSYYRNYFGTVSRGFTRINLKQEYVKGALIPLPSSEEQTAIANFLDQKTTQIDQAIVIKEKQITLLKERKQILIQNAITCGLNPDAPMRDSGVEWIGVIPDHWQIVRLKTLFSETNKRTKTGEEVLFSLRMEHGLVPHEEVSDKYISDENLVDYKIVYSGQMVMNRMRAAIGIFGLATEHGLVSPDYAVFNIGHNANPEYFLRLFKMPLLGTQFRLHSKGLGTGSSGFMRLYTENFGNIKIALPPLDEQGSIVKYIETESTKIDKAITLLQQQIKKLKEYKATLINSAVTGKIKVALGSIMVSQTNKLPLNHMMEYQTL